MQQETIAGITLKTIARKVAPIFFLNLVVWILANIAKYVIFLNEPVDWEQLITDSFSFAILCTFILEFKRIRLLIRMIRNGEWS